MQQSSYYNTNTALIIHTAPIYFAYNTFPSLIEDPFGLAESIVYMRSHALTPVCCSLLSAAAAVRLVKQTGAAVSVSQRFWISTLWPWLSQSREHKRCKTSLPLEYQRCPVHLRRTPCRTYNTATSNVYKKNVCRITLT